MNAAEKFPERPALRVQGTLLKYRELKALACAIAATIQSRPEFSAIPLTAVFAYRSSVAFAGVLGSLLAGNGYLPLNRTFPVERTRLMLERSECRSIIVDVESLAQLDSVLKGHGQPFLIVIPELEDVSQFRERWPQHCIFGHRDLSPEHAWCAQTVTDDSIGYLLFTSGSTGVPKGVLVAQSNVVHFVDYIAERYQITEHDRLSQTFDMTFDVSAFDMFVSWERGALLCCPSRKTLIHPGPFIKRERLTVWFSVPSTAAFMKQLGMLKPNSYPSLRLSLFAGEPLPISTVDAWQQAAPGSVLENLYGPTELTISCTLYRWDPTRSPAESELGIVPIGHPFPGMNAIVVDNKLCEVSPGEEGELLMSGPQMSLGYWKDAKKTADAFVVPPGKTDTYYRTGDRVRRPIGSGPYTHLGRIDFQVKILGHRAELGEIETVARHATGLEGVIAVGWPVVPSGYGGVEIFLEGPQCDILPLRRAIASKLPDYMVPRRFHFMNRLPRNANGKFDRRAMTEELEKGL